MGRSIPINQESFEALLTWLSPERDEAGLKYELIRTGLVRIFVAKGFSDAEDLADQTINRVIIKLPEIRGDFVGEPVSYFRGVARKIMLEAWRRKEVTTDRPPEQLSKVQVNNPQSECLDRCLRLLSEGKRDLILDYYLYKGHDKIAHHKLLARENGISESALRVKAHRIRNILEKCVVECV